MNHEGPRVTFPLPASLNPHLYGGGLAYHHGIKVRLLAPPFGLMVFKKLLRKGNLKALREAFGMFRSRYFTIQPPETPAFSLSGVSPTDIERDLGRIGYHRDKELSYKYKGEVLNMTRYFYDGNRDCPWRQVHVRAVKGYGGTLQFYCHEEPTPTDHPEAHYEETDVRSGLGSRLVREDLEACGYQV